MFRIDIPEELQEVFDRVRSRGDIFSWKHCTLDSNGRTEEVFCMLCGDIILGTRECEDPKVMRLKDEANTVLVLQRVRNMPYNNYKQVSLHMEDGSEHITQCCKSCAPRLKHMPVDKLYSFYVADCSSLADNCMSKREMDTVVAMTSRQPIRVEIPEEV